MDKKSCWTLTLKNQTFQQWPLTPRLAQTWFRRKSANTELPSHFLEQIFLGCLPCSFIKARILFHLWAHSPKWCLYEYSEKSVKEEPRIFLKYQGAKSNKEKILGFWGWSTENNTSIILNTALAAYAISSDGHYASNIPHPFLILQSCLKRFANGNSGSTFNGITL